MSSICEFCKSTKIVRAIKPPESWGVANRKYTLCSECWAKAAAGAFKKLYFDLAK
jgi:hypothetical protein